MHFEKCGEMTTIKWQYCVHTKEDEIPENIGHSDPWQWLFFRAGKVHFLCALVCGADTKRPRHWTTGSTWIRLRNLGRRMDGKRRYTPATSTWDRCRDKNSTGQLSNSYNRRIWDQLPLVPSRWYLPVFAVLQSRPSNCNWSFQGYLNFNIKRQQSFQIATFFKKWNFTTFLFMPNTCS